VSENLDAQRSGHSTQPVSKEGSPGREKAVGDVRARSDAGQRQPGAQPAGRSGQAKGRSGNSANRARGPVSTEELIAELAEVSERLRRDSPSRVDVKIMVRALKELRYAFKVFAPYRSRRKVTMFGSARISSEHPAYRQAVEFGRAMADAGWMVVTGAASGIMEAGHEGAGREHSMGVNILLPFEQDANPIIAGDRKLVHFKYFFTRKLIFVKETDATAVFPGGFGTLDEGFEVLTLVQTGKREMIPIVLIDEPGGDYWSAWQRYVKEQLLARGYISEPDLNLFKVTDNVDVAVREILRFYRVYHSMRYVGDILVLRLQRELPQQMIERLNVEFKDLLAEGRFEQRQAFPEERDDKELLHMPRLAFRFVKRDFGRLRQLIDTINTCDEP